MIEVLFITISYNIVPILSLIITIFIAYKIHILNNSNNVKRDKMIFYNEAYNSFQLNRLSSCPLDLKREGELNKVNNYIKSVQYILKYRNICVSDNIWKGIDEHIHSVSLGHFKPNKLEYNQIIDCDIILPLMKGDNEVENRLYKMKKKYEEKYYN